MLRPFDNFLCYQDLFSLAGLNFLAFLPSPLGLYAYVLFCRNNDSALTQAVFPIHLPGPDLMGALFFSSISCEKKKAMESRESLPGAPALQVYIHITNASYSFFPFQLLTSKSQLYTQA
jgi:hypothetical protein